MAGILEYSTTPSSNTTINGIGISGSSSIKYGDDAIRQFMADVRSAVTKASDKAAGTHMATKADHNQLWRVTGNATVNLTSAATLTAGWSLWVMADGGTATIDPASSEQINGAATLTLSDGNAALIICTATAFRAVIFNGPVIVGTTPGTVAGGVAALQYKGAIGASEDLDTYTTPGIYVQNQSAGASGGTNYPVANAGMLEVLDGGGATNVQTVQRYTEYSQPPIVWQRMRRNAGNWSAWDKIISQSSLPPVTPPANKRIYTSSTTWVKPDGLTKVIVTVVGGGGGGGRNGNTANLSGGGGGGGMSFKEILAVDLSSTEVVTIGSGGSGGTGSQGAAGGTGGASSFGSHLSATGGGGGSGAGAGSTTGAGGFGLNGVINLPGGGNSFGGVDKGHGGGTAIFTMSTPDGLTPPQWGGGGPRSASANTDGIDGNSGVVIVEEYF